MADVLCNPNNRHGAVIQANVTSHLVTLPSDTLDRRVMRPSWAQLLRLQTGITRSPNLKSQETRSIFVSAHDDLDSFHFAFRIPTHFNKSLNHPPQPYHPPYLTPTIPHHQLLTIITLHFRCQDRHASIVRWCPSKINHCWHS